MTDDEIVDGIITNSVDMNLGKFRENPCGQRSLASHSPWGCKESYTPEQLTHINTRSE